MRASLPAAASAGRSAARRRPRRSSTRRARAGRPRSRPSPPSATSPVEALARVAPDVLGLDERVERLARRARSSARPRRADGGRRPRRRAPARRRAPRRARCRTDRRRAATRSRARGTSGRASRGRRRCRSPIVDVDAVARVERAVGDRHDEALEPRPDLAARLEARARRTAVAHVRLEPHRGVVGGRRVGELRRAPVGGEARGDLQPRALVVAVGADLVGDRPRAERAGDDGPSGRDPGAADVARIRVDRHRVSGGRRA